MMERDLKEIGYFGQERDQCTGEVSFYFYNLIFISKFKI